MGLPVSDFGVDAVTRELIQNEHRLALRNNNGAIRGWNLRVATVQQNNEIKAALKIPLERIPDPPMLMVIDDDKIAEMEAISSQTGDMSQVSNIQFYHYEQYKPPFHIVLPEPKPMTMITDEAPGYPGYFNAINDGPFNQPGTKIQQDGFTYTKHTFGAFGSAMWKKETATPAVPATPSAQS